MFRGPLITAWPHDAEFGGVADELAATIDVKPRFSGADKCNGEPFAGLTSGNFITGPRLHLDGGKAWGAWEHAVARIDSCTIAPIRRNTQNMPAENLDTWLVVPLYNEATVVRGVIEAARETFPNIVCVDDGSSDASVSEALAGGAIVVRHPINLGQGAALQTGLDFARMQPEAKYFVTFDSDGQHLTEDAERMVQRLRNEPLDIVVGSRFLDDRTNASALKKFVLRLAVMFERLSTGVKLTDAHNGLRALNVTAADAIRIQQNRMAHASEIVGLIGKKKLRYAEESVQIVYTEYSKAKGQSLWNSVNILSELFIK